MRNDKIDINIMPNEEDQVMSKEKIQNNEKLIAKVMETIKIIQKYDNSPDHTFTKEYFERTNSYDGLKEYLLSKKYNQNYQPSQL